MSQVDQDFTMYQGETKQVTVAVVDGDGDPLNLTGATLEWMMSYKANEATADALLTKTPTLVNVAGTNDGVRISLAPAI